MYSFSGKRQREDDEDLEVVSPGSECKKLRTLPFRSSPTQKPAVSFFSSSRHVPKPPALTPAESSEDESDIEILSPKQQSRRKARPTVPAFFATAEDMELDMDEPQPFASPMWSPKSPSTTMSLVSPLYPKLLAAGSSSVNQTSRIPTPIYGHFSTLHNPIQKTNSPTAARPSVCGVARSTVAEQHDAFLRRRALPSPISEDENMESPTVITKSMFRDLNVSTTPVSGKFPPRFNETALMTPESPEFGLRKDSTCSTTSTTSTGTSSSTFSRRRSDAISGGEDGRKVVFSMGFRADCDKCKERVPGHYSHVLRV